MHTFWSRTEIHYWVGCSLRARAHSFWASQSLHKASSQQMLNSQCLLSFLLSHDLAHDRLSISICCSTAPLCANLKSIPVCLPPPPATQSILLTPAAAPLVHPYSLPMTGPRGQPFAPYTQCSLSDDKCNPNSPEIVMKVADTHREVLIVVWDMERCFLKAHKMQ